MERLRAPEHGRHRLHGDADDVVVRLARGERAPGGLRVEAELQRAGIRRPEALAHDVRPQPARGAELRDFLDQVVVRGEEEREPLAEPVDVEPGRARGLDVGDRVGDRERDLLHRRRAGLADVIPADRDRVPLGQLALAPREDVGDDAQRVTRRVDVGAARDVLLQDVVLDRARERADRGALPLRDGDVEREQDDRRRVDRHRRRDAIERDAVEERGHVLDRVDGDADAADFAGGERVIRVVAHLRGQIEGDAQPAHALRQQVAVPRIRFGGGAEARVLPHRPEAAAVHRGLEAAGVGIEAGELVTGLGRTGNIARPRKIARHRRHSSARNCNRPWLAEAPARRRPAIAITDAVTFAAG